MSMMMTPTDMMRMRELRERAAVALLPVIAAQMGVDEHGRPCQPSPEEVASRVLMYADALALGIIERRGGAV